MLLLNTLAFMGVGFMTLHLAERTHVLDPAIGAGGAVLLFGAVQVALVPALRQELGRVRSRRRSWSPWRSPSRLRGSAGWSPPGAGIARRPRARRVALLQRTAPHHLLAAAQPITAPMNQLGVNSKAREGVTLDRGVARRCGGGRIERSEAGCIHRGVCPESARIPRIQDPLRASGHAR
jgi:hypothetical protein